MSASQQENNKETKIDYVPKRFGLSYDPPQIVVEYQKPSSGKLYHHKIKFRGLTPQSKISDLIDEMYKQHNSYLNHKRVSKAQIIQLVEKLREKYFKIKRMKEENEKENEEINNNNKNNNVEVNKNSLYNFDENEDLNKLTKEELDEKKKHMDEFYNKNNIKFGDEGYEYDVRKDFSNDGYAEWDDEE